MARSFLTGMDWRQWAASSPPSSALNQQLADLLASSDLPAETYAEDALLVVRIAVPGIDSDRDVDISVSAGWLVVRVRRPEPAKREGRVGYQSELRYGTFARCFAIPTDVLPEAARVSYDAGILEIRIELGSASPARCKLHVDHP